MVKVALFGLIGVLLAIQFKSGKSEYGIYIAFATSCILFFYAIQKLELILSGIEVLKSYLGGKESYLLLLFKIIGITYLAEFSADLCKDAGYGTIAGQIELIGKLSILLISIPVFLSLFASIQSF